MRPEPGLRERDSSSLRQEVKALWAGNVIIGRLMAVPCKAFRAKRRPKLRGGGAKMTACLKATAGFSLPKFIQSVVSTTAILLSFHFVPVGSCISRSISRSRNSQSALSCTNGCLHAYQHLWLGTMAATTNSNLRHSSPHSQSNTARPAHKMSLSYSFLASSHYMDPSHLTSQRQTKTSLGRSQSMAASS